MAELHAYRVGALYRPGVRRLQEGTEYNYRQGAHELRLLWRSPSSREVQAIKSGTASFGVAVHGPIMFFLYQFSPALPWSDAPFSVWLVPDEQRSVPEPTDVAEPHALLQVILVDAGAGIIRALRVVSLSPALTTALHLAIRDQHEAGWPGQPAYDRALADTYQRYPTTTALLETARVVDDPAGQP